MPVNAVVSDRTKRKYIVKSGLPRKRSELRLELLMHSEGNLQNGTDRETIVATLSGHKKKLGLVPKFFSKKGKHDLEPEEHDLVEAFWRRSNYSPTAFQKALLRANKNGVGFFFSFYNNFFFYPLNSKTYPLFPSF